jgi:hypothetical protein
VAGAIGRARLAGSRRASEDVRLDHHRNTCERRRSLHRFGVAANPVGARVVNDVRLDPGEHGSKVADVPLEIDAFYAPRAQALETRPGAKAHGGHVEDRSRQEGGADLDGLVRAAEPESAAELDHPQALGGGIAGACHAQRGTMNPSSVPAAYA